MLSTLQERNSAVDRNLSRYLGEYLRRTTQAPATQRDHLLTLSRERSRHSFKSVDIQLTASVSTQGSSFMREMLAELRRQLCSRGKGGKPLGGPAEAIVSGVAIAVCHKLGVESTTGSAIAFAILLALARATKRSFCRMTDEEVLRALEEKRG